MTIADLNSLVQNVFDENYIGDMIKKGLLYKKIPIRLKKNKLTLQTSLYVKVWCKTTFMPKKVKSGPQNVWTDQKNADRSYAEIVLTCMTQDKFYSSNNTSKSIKQLKKWSLMFRVKFLNNDTL